MSTFCGYHVVSNHLGQYSIWLAGKELPQGWQLRSETMSKEDCLSLIEASWKDMRPKSGEIFTSVLAS